eukprot:1159381-Pelagomonas_calceolata.AAC.9
MLDQPSIFGRHPIHQGVQQQVADAFTAAVNAAAAAAAAAPVAWNRRVEAIHLLLYLNQISVKCSSAFDCTDNLFGVRERRPLFETNLVQVDLKMCVHTRGSINLWTDVRLRCI